jgi:pimeloyl-ACP methyl ester carboxylesterase
MEQKSVHVNGVDLAYVERGSPRDDAPSLLFVHATGFHGRLWDYHAEALGDYHSIALDQRGHGRSSKVAVEHWRTFGQDQAAFVDALNLTNLIGIGHSMGAHGMIDAAALTDAFSHLVLLDPTVASPEAYGDAVEVAADAELHPAAKRQRDFDSVEDMFERIRPKSAFPLFDSRILRDYCQFGLERNEDGRFTLCCLPEIEARVYMSARSNAQIYDSVHKLDIPVTIVRARSPADAAVHDFTSSPTWPGLVRKFAHAEELHWPDCTHFIPMQKPDEVIAVIRNAITSVQPRVAG